MYFEDTNRFVSSKYNLVVMLGCNSLDCWELNTDILFMDRWEWTTSIFQWVRKYIDYGKFFHAGVVFCAWVRIIDYCCWWCIWFRSVIFFGWGFWNCSECFDRVVDVVVMTVAVVFEFHVIVELVLLGLKTRHCWSQAGCCCLLFAQQSGWTHTAGVRWTSVHLSKVPGFFSAMFGNMS